ncbi:MAG TPA: ATP-binding protein [Bacteroidales bacterium]|nr:ATP-binding protein [Bacteroidales bacterium]
MFTFNTIYSKIRIFLISVGIIFVFLFIVLIFLKYQTEKQIVTSYKEQFQHEAHSLLTMKSEEMDRTVTDYTFWDEFVEAIRTKDTSWLCVNVSITATFNYNYTGIYNNKLDLIYEFYNDEPSGEIIPPEILNEIKRTRFLHYFMYVNGELMEICGSSIHPSSDPTHEKTKEEGYMFAGRQLNARYLKKLSEINGSEVKIQSSDLLSSDNNKIIQALYPLKGWDNKNVANIVFTRDVNFNFKGTQQLMYILMAFVVLFLFITNFFARLYINTPLELFADILKTENPDSIHKLKNSASEYGRIGNLFAHYVHQKKELHEAKEKAQQSESRISALLKTIPDLIIVLDQSGVYIDYYTMDSLDLFKKPEFFIGKRMYEVLPADVAANYKQYIDEAIRTKTVQVFEYSLPMPTGEEYYECKLTAFEDNKILSLIRNITQRKHGENAVKESEIKFKEIINQVNDGIIVVDEQQKVIVWNKGAEQVLGLMAEDTINKNVTDVLLQIASPKLKVKLTEENVIEKLINFQKPELFNNLVDNEIINRHTGQFRNIQANIFPIQLEKINLFCSIFRDTTDIKQYENQLLLLNRDKDRFISIIAHDLKNPFNAILGLSDILVENIHNATPDVTEKQLRFINSSAHQFYFFLDEILLWAKAKSGKLPFQPQRLNVRDVCYGIMEIYKLNAHIKNITVKYQEEEATSIVADRNMFKTIIANLLSNAIKFTRTNGMIDISARHNHSSTIITISDNGIGIKPEFLPTMFDNANAHTTDGTSSEKGTGLGLSLCREFVEAHNGKIWVESEYGKGSAFSFSIPENALRNWVAS